MRPASRFWTSRGSAGIPRLLPRQRTATQFMSGESVKISPRTVDLTYGLYLTMCAKAQPPTACRSQRLWPGDLFKLYCREADGGVATSAPSFCFQKIFHPMILLGVL